MAARALIGHWEPLVGRTEPKRIVFSRLSQLTRSREEGTMGPSTCVPSPLAAASLFKSQTKQLALTVLPRSSSQVFRIQASAEMSKGKRNANDDIIMVDPLEAKQLAAKQMQEIQAREKLKRQRQIEAINGAWAMIGLTAGLVIEGSTGNSILEQLTGYLHAIGSFFGR